MKIKRKFYKLLRRKKRKKKDHIQKMRNQVTLKFSTVTPGATDQHLQNYESK